MRTCSVCGEEKPNSAFHAEPRVRDGLAAACRLCVKANRKGRHQPGKTRSGSSEQMRARGKVRDAVRYGKLIKPDRCAQCGEPTPNHLLDGHHEDYSKPLDVIWLCRSCHGLRADGGVEGHAGTRPTVIACDTGVEKAATVAPEYGVGIKPGPSEANSPAAPEVEPVAWRWRKNTGEILSEWIDQASSDYRNAKPREFLLNGRFFNTGVCIEKAYAAPVDAGVREALIDALAGLKYIEPAIPVLRTMFMTADLALGARKAEEMDASNKEAIKKLEAVLATISSQPVVRVDQKETPLRRTDR